ncbi:MAG TPA: hypothetical protein VFP65_22140 [Anaeromyxobacteraceae bacterium]|nr:hypothetical protein [Anaeromyxobacteraceae bacterium]
MLTRTAKPRNVTDPPGMPCPRCGKPIRLSIEKLLTATPVYCSDCGLQLVLDRRASAEGLDAARALQNAMKDLVGSK